MSMPSLDPDELSFAVSEPTAPVVTDETLPSLDEGSVAVEEPAAGVDAAQNLHAEPARDGWTLVALIPHDGQEPPADLSDDSGAVGLVRGLGSLASVAPGSRRPITPDRVG